MTSYKSFRFLPSLAKVWKWSMTSGGSRLRGPYSEAYEQTFRKQTVSESLQPYLTRFHAIGTWLKIIWNSAYCSPVIDVCFVHLCIWDLPQKWSRNVNAEVLSGTVCGERAIYLMFSQNHNNRPFLLRVISSGPLSFFIYWIFSELYLPNVRKDARFQLSTWNPNKQLTNCAYSWWQGD